MDSVIFDIDGTICPIKKVDENYEDLIPYNNMIEKIKELKNEGFKIILFTARNMRTFKNDITKINKYTRPILETWLKKWDIPYDELIFGKPWPGKNGFYVDDKTIRPDELLKFDLKNINKIIKKEGDI